MVTELQATQSFAYELNRENKSKLMTAEKRIERAAFPAAAATAGTVGAVDAFSKQPQHKEKHEFKPLVLATTALGTLASMFLISRHATAKNKALQAAGQLAKGEHVKVDMLNIHYGFKKILALATGSIAGGFIGGVITDKGEGTDKKAKEAIYQLITNIVTPLSFVMASEHLLKKVNIKMPQLKGTGKAAGIANKVLVAAPNILGTLVAIFAGVQTGTFISNKVNGALPGDKYQRTIKLQDYLIQVDDLVSAVTLMDTKGVFANITGKLVPAVFLISGYEVGTKK